MKNKKHSFGSVPFIAKIGYTFYNRLQKTLYESDPFEIFGDYEWIKEHGHPLKNIDVSFEELRVTMSKDRQNLIKQAKEEYNIAGGDLDWLRPLEKYEKDAGLKDERDLWHKAIRDGVKIRVLATSLTPNTILETLETAKDIGADVRRYESPHPEHVRVGYIDGGIDGQAIINILDDDTERIEGKSQKPHEGIWVVYKLEHGLLEDFDKLYKTKFDFSDTYEDVMEDREKKSLGLNRIIGQLTL